MDGVKNVKLQVYIYQEKCVYIYFVFGYKEDI